MKSVVVIVVNYNSGEWLERCVKALLASDYPIKAYVVDNASTDKSLMTIMPLLNDHQNLHLIENKKNFGFAKANNLILNTIGADYYVLINPDCIVEPQTIGFIINSLLEDPHVGLAGARVLNEDGSVQKTSRRRFPTPENTLTKVLGLNGLFKNNQKFADFNYGDNLEMEAKQFVDAVSGAFMVVSGQALIQTGGLDEGYFMHCEDIDWCKRVWLQGFKVAYYPQASVTHGKGKSSQSIPYAVNWHLHIGMLRFYRKFYRKNYGKIISGLIYTAVAGRLTLTNIKIFITRNLLK